MPFQKRLRLSMILIITAVVLIIAECSYFVIRPTIDNQVNKEISATLSSKSQEFDKWIIQQQSTIAYFGDSIQYNKMLETFSNEELEQFLADKLTEYVMDYYIAKPDKSVVFASGFQLPEDFDVTARDWYKATIAANGALTCTSPYIDNNTGKLCMTVSQAFYDDSSQLEFVMGADIYADYLEELTESISIFENAYAILADSDYNIIVHRDDAYRMSVGDDGNASVTSLKDIPEYSGIISRLESDDYSVLKTKDYDGKKRYFIMSEISSTGWYYIYAVDSLEYYNQIVPLMISLFIIFILDIAVSSVVITFIVKKLLKPIEELKTAAGNMKNGKLG
ncbi:MAG: cache domain-containing protein, partial [Oscillospiraceae bacterium]